MGRLPKSGPDGKEEIVLQASLEGSCLDRHPDASALAGLDALSRDPPDSTPRGLPSVMGQPPAETVRRAEPGRPAGQFPYARPARWCCRPQLPASENEPPSLQRFLVHSASLPARARAEFPECELLPPPRHASTDTFPQAA